MIWTVAPSSFEGWGTEGWVPQDFDPVLRIDGSPRKVGQVLFHPSAEGVLAASGGECTVKLWDIANPEEPRAVLNGHGDVIQSMAFNPTGTLLATTCRDRKLRIFDPRIGGEPVRVGDGHGGIKGSRVTWMGELDKIATTGFSKMSDRQVGIWEVGGLGNVKTISLDMSAGVVMPFWTDNQILFLAGKGYASFVLFFSSRFHLVDHVFSEMGIYDTTNTNPTLYTHSQNTNHQNPNAGCVSSPGAHSTSQSVRSHGLTRSMGPASSLFHSSFPERWVLSLSLLWLC